MDIRIDVIQSVTDILECISISQIQQASVQDKHLQCLRNSIITGWPSTKDDLHSNLRPYWSFRDGLAVINGVVIKGRCIIIPAILKQQVLDQLHLNHMGIKKTKLLTCESIYWVGINTDIDRHIKIVTCVLSFSGCSPRRR